MPVFYESNSLSSNISIDQSLEMTKIHITKTDRKVLQQLILTRLISALEVYLIDNIRVVFMHNKQPFLTQDRFELAQSEILNASNIEYLQNKILNKLCRSLHSAGFKAICKFYQNTFEVDCKSFNVIIDGLQLNYEYLEKIHEMRHLIVHNLGIADEAFKEKYNYKPRSMQFESQEFHSMFGFLREFANFISNSLERFFNINTTIVDIESTESKIIIEILDEKVLNIFNDNYSFKCFDGIRNFSTIKKSIQRKENIITLRIIGNRKIIGQYNKILKGNESKGYCKIEKQEYFRDFHESKKTEEN